MNDSNRERAIELINAYFDNKDIVVKDPIAGIEYWMPIPKIQEDKLW